MIFLSFSCETNRLVLSGVTWEDLASGPERTLLLETAGKIFRHAAKIVDKNIGSYIQTSFFLPISFKAKKPFSLNRN